MIWIAPDALVEFSVQSTCSAQPVRHNNRGGACWDKLRMSSRWHALIQTCMQTGHVLPGPGVGRNPTMLCLQLWRQLDDTIMGGQSSSSLEANGDGSGAVWTGDLIVVRAALLEHQGTYCDSPIQALTIQAHLLAEAISAKSCTIALQQEGGGFCGARTASR